MKWKATSWWKVNSRDKQQRDASLLTSSLFLPHNHLFFLSPQSHNHTIHYLDTFNSFSLNPACGLGRHGECLLHTLDTCACICSRCAVSGTNNVDRLHPNGRRHLGSYTDYPSYFGLDRVHCHYPRPSDCSDDSDTRNYDSPNCQTRHSSDHPY